MPKRLRRILVIFLLPIVIIGLLIVYQNIRSKNTYASDPLEITYNGETTPKPIFNLSDMKPGDKYERCFKVKNKSVKPFTVDMLGVKTNEEKNFSDVLKVKIYKSPSDEIIFEGLLKDFFNHLPFDLGNISSLSDKTYCIDVEFQWEAGNEYQKALLVFDIEFRAKVGQGIVINEVYYNVDPSKGSDCSSDMKIKAEISGNGSNTTNIININISNTCLVVQQNNANIVNNVTTSSQTGLNSIIGNLGSTNIQTGVSSLYINLINKLNVNIAQNTCCCPSNPVSNDEWVEIYNPTEETVNLKGWKIKDNSGQEVTIGVDVNLAPGEFLLISKSLSTWQYWNEDPNAKKVALGSDIGNGLDNAGDHLYLINPYGVIIDFMAWGSDNIIWNPYDNPVASEGKSVSRVPNGYDTDLPADWVSNIFPPTPGY